MLILLDMDGPLADLEQGLLDAWRRLYPRTFFVPVEKRTSFCPLDDYPERLHKKIVKMCRAPGFFLNLPPTPGALRAVELILLLGHDVRICTSPLRYYENCVLEKYLWVERHFGHEFTDRITLTRDKTLVHGDVLIDDKPEITSPFKKPGTADLPDPSWEHVLFDAPYNQHIKNKKRLNWINFDWRKILGI